MAAGQQQRGACGGLSASVMVPRTELLQQQQAVRVQLAQQLRCWAWSLCHLVAEEALFWASPLSV